MIMETGELYAVDLPNVSSLKSEVHNWYTKWKTEEKDHGSPALPSLSSALPRIPNNVHLQLLVLIIEIYCAS